jgi:histidine ammonia-lyase
MDGNKTGLPTFLTSNPGLNSGLMMAHVTAAALVAEARSLAFPASTDSIPTNCDREDHVSMGPGAGFKAVEIVNKIRYVLAVELVSAAQALSLSGNHVGRPKLMWAVNAIRKIVPELTEDRPIGPDIEAVAQLVSGGFPYPAVEEFVGPISIPLSD